MKGIPVSRFWQAFHNLPGQGFGVAGHKRYALRAFWIGLIPLAAAVWLLYPGVLSLGPLGVAGVVLMILMALCVSGLLGCVGAVVYQMKLDREKVAQ